MRGVPTKAMIREYGLLEAMMMHAERTAENEQARGGTDHGYEKEMAMIDNLETTGDEYGREIVNAEQLPVRVEVLVPTPDGEGEVVGVRGTSIVDAVENAVVAYGDAELMFPIEPGDVVYVGDLAYLGGASEFSARA